MITCRQLYVDGNKTCGLILSFATQVHEPPTAPFPCNYTRKAIRSTSSVSFLLFFLYFRCARHKSGETDVKLNMLLKKTLKVVNQTSCKEEMWGCQITKLHYEVITLCVNFSTCSRYTEDIIETTLSHTKRRQWSDCKIILGGKSSLIHDAQLQNLTYTQRTLPSARTLLWLKNAKGDYGNVQPTVFPPTDCKTQCAWETSILTCKRTR